MVTSSRWRRPRLRFYISFIILEFYTSIKSSPKVNVSLFVQGHLKIDFTDLKIIKLLIRQIITCIYADDIVKIEFQDLDTKIIPIPKVVENEFT